MNKFVLNLYDDRPNNQPKGFLLKPALEENSLLPLYWLNDVFVKEYTFYI